MSERSINELLGLKDSEMSAEEFMRVVDYNRLYSIDGKKVLWWIILAVKYFFIGLVITTHILMGYLETKKIYLQNWVLFVIPLVVASAIVFLTSALNTTTIWSVYIFFGSWLFFGIVGYLHLKDPLIEEIGKIVSRLSRVFGIILCFGFVIYLVVKS
jgi:hypothetical protein